MKLNTGVPGVGKTYLMVKSFIDLFCFWDKETGRFILKEEHKGKILVSNVEGLTLPHLDIETLMNERCMQLANTKFIDNIGSHDLEKMQDVVDEYYYQFLEEKVRWFFNYSYQKQLCDKHGPIIYLIEESQRYFDSKELGRQKWVRDVLYFFEKHRHFGHSIFCDTQHHSKLHKGLVALFETETRAKSRTLSVMGEFKYNEYSDDAKINQLPIIVKPDKRIYQIYKSMAHKEDVKTKKPVLKILIFVCVMAAFSLFILNYAKNNLGTQEAQANPATITNQSADNQPGGTARSPVPNSTIQPQKRGSWVHLDFTIDTKGTVTIVHPETFAIMPLKELELEVKRQGTQLYCFIEENENGR